MASRRQLSAIHSYAAAQGLTIARVFREEGVSGTLEGIDRRALVEMITGILTNGVKTIVIEKLGTDNLVLDKSLIPKTTNGSASQLLLRLGPGWR